MFFNKNKWKISLALILCTGYFLNVFSGDEKAFAGVITQKEEFSAQAFYSEKCINCHASDGKPKRTGVPDLSLPEFQKNRTDDQIGVSIMNGKPPKMPAYKTKLDKDKLKGLVVYIRAFERK